MTDTDNLPPVWALDMAAKAAGRGDDTWAVFLSAGWRPSDYAYGCIIAHARTLERLAKHEPELVPVDPDLLVAREICAKVASSIGDHRRSGGFSAGVYDHYAAIAFTLTKLREARNA